jgi:carbonic anhydrase
VRISRVLIVLCCFIAVAGFVYAGLGTGDDSLTKLIDGNKRYVSGSLAKKDIGDTRRQELTKGQHPFATVLSCSDSRVAPELVFDQGLGDIFIIRVAGNVIEPTTLGSIEYGAEHLHTPLLVILGHEQCGAVTAAFDAKGNPEGNIGAILKKIMPAVATAKKAKKGKDETLQIAIEENIRNTHKDIMKNSKIIKELVHEGKLKVVGAVYSLNTGKIAMVDLADAGNDGKHHHHH